MTALGWLALTGGGTALCFTVKAFRRHAARARLSLAPVPGLPDDGEWLTVRERDALDGIAARYDEPLEPGPNYYQAPGWPP